MLLGKLSESPAQRRVLPVPVGAALDALERMNAVSLAQGRYDIDGDRLFCLVQDATPRLLEDSRAEAHRDYVDVQLPIGATECFGFALPQPGLNVVEDAMDERDIAFFATPENECFLDVAPGSYIVFWPGELHRPCVAIEGCEPFRKIVVKIHRSLFGL